MSIQWNEEKQAWEYDGLTDEEEANYQSSFDTSTLQEMGILDGEDAKALEQSYNEGQQKLEEKHKNILTKADEFMGYVSPKADKNYEKLNALDTAVDIGKAVGTEALHIIQPKDKETQYEARTHFAENMKYLYRYGAGLLGTGKVGALLKAPKIISAANKGSKIAKAMSKTGKVLTADFKFLEAAENGNKLAKAGKIALSGTIDGFVGDFFVGRPDEGEGLLGDMLPDSENPIVQYFQTDTMDSGLEWRLKNAIQGLVLGIPLNFAMHGLGKMVSSTFKQLTGLKKVAKATNEKEALDAINEVRVAEAQTDNILKGQSLIDEVQNAFDEAVAKSSEDIESFVLNKDFVTQGNSGDVLDILTKLQKGQTVIPNEDGSFTIQITKWQDAADVSMDELKAQTGNDGISLMNEAVKDTWTERGWLAEGESIINTDVKTGKQTVNTKAVKRIKDNYINKWKIDNKIDIEFVDGKINGADATTQTLEYKGKVVKDKQNAIDKKKLQIKELEDKITMLQGGNKAVSDPLDVLKEKLRIAKQELKELEEPNKLANIKILINKKANDIEAILRSELEHTRDIVKKEVPKDNSKHFSRYNGMNESEASLEYIRHKALNRQDKAEFEKFLSEIEETKKSISPDDAKYITETNLREINNKYTFEDTVMTVDGQDYDTIVAKNKAGEIVGHVRYTLFGKDSIWVNMAQRHSDISGEGRVAIAALMSKYPDKTLYWEAINQRSVDSYKHFIKEYPEFAKRVDFQDRVDYNIPKGINNEKSNTNQPINQRSDNLGERNRTSDKETYEQADGSRGSQYDLYGSNNKRILPESNSTVNERGKDTNLYEKSNVQSGEIQSNNARESISSSEQRAIAKVENINKQLDNITKDPEKKVIPWKVNLDNAQDIYNKLQSRGIDNLAGLKEAVSKGDVDYVNMVVEKQLAAERHISDLRTELNSLPETATERIEEILNEIQITSAIVQDLASAYGRGLNAQKLVKKVRNIFSLSSMEELGLDNMADLLSVDIKNLNFTRGLPDAKRQLYEKIAKYGNGDVLRQIQADSSTAEAFDKYLERMIQNRLSNVQDIKRLLREFSNPIRKRDLLQLIKQTPDDENIPKVLKAYKANGGIESYIVHNLLSNVGTTIANVLSGAINSVYFPFTKILGGLLGGGDTLTKEGVYQLKGLMDTFNESWEMAVQAFKTGEGNLINLGKRVPMEADSDKYIGFNAWGEFGKGDNWFETLQNYHSVFTRLMGASDEFLTQMNYRSITRAKYLVQAEELAQKVGREGDYAWIEQQAQKNFNSAFTIEGKPLDVTAYSEARDIVYQTPLSGKMWDYNTASYSQIKEQTVMMGMAEAATQAAMKYPSLKLLLPFIRTPANIGQMALEHNPIYAICSPSQRRLLMSNSQEGAIARAKVGLGIASTIVGYNLAAQGFVTGSPPIDEKERAALFKTGWRPYSFRVGDKYISYAKLEPVCTILGYSADMFHLTQSYNPDADVFENAGKLSQEAVSSIVSSTFDKASFMNGMEQFSHIYKFIKGQDNTPVEQIYRSLQMFLPMNAGIQALSTVGETEARTPQGLYDTLFNKYLNKGLGDYKRNIWGERQDIYNYFIATGSKGLDENLPEDAEIQRLADLGWKPTELANNEYGSTVKYKDFKNIETNRTFYDTMLEEMTTIEIDGKTLREAVREEIESADYQASVDGIGTLWNGEKDTKKNRIAAIFNDYKKAAKNKVIDEQGDMFVNKQGLTADEQREQDRQEKEAERLKASIEQSLQDIRSFS